MDMFATLHRSGGINALARRLGESPADTASAAQVLLPPLIARYRQYYRGPGGGERGIAAITSLFTGLDDGQREGGGLAFEIFSPGPIATERAGKILARVFPEDGGAEIVSEADRVGSVDRRQLVRMLPLLNMLVGGYLLARVQTAGEAGGALVTEIERLLQ